MCGLFSGKIKIEEAYDFFDTKFTVLKTQKKNESKNIENGCNILKTMNKMIFFQNMCNMNKTVKKRILKKKKYLNLMNKKIYVFF